MALIITATDFSHVAQNAVNYACDMASDLKADVLIIHTFIMPVMFTDVPMPSNLIPDAQSDADKQVAETVARLSAAHPGIHITGKASYGNIIDTLDEFANSDMNPLMVVIGNSTTTVSNSWPDSITLDAFRQLKFPVLGVPENAAYRPVNKVLFAFDNKSKHSDVAMVQLREITHLTKCQLHVLHAEEDTMNRDNLQDIDDSVKALLAPANPHYHIIYEADINETVDKTIKNNDIDWLVVIPRKHSFFQGLFHKSHTKVLASKSPIPVLALHESQE